MSEKKIKLGIRGVSVLLTAILLLTLPNVNLPKPMLPVKLPVTLIPIEELIELERERPRPKIPPIPIAAAPAKALMRPSPVYNPVETPANPSDIPVANPSELTPEFGLMSELYERPLEPQPQRLEPVASPLPDILTTKAETGESYPPAALPSPVAQRGEVYRGSGSPDLDVSTTPNYTGPALSVPTTDIAGTGLTRGGQLSGSPTPGTGLGENFKSSAGTIAGPATGSSLSGKGDDVVGEGELSGLLNWLRNQRATFPAVVMSYMGTRESDLKGIAGYAGWDIFIQFSEAEHQLKIFLTRGATGILLADSDFKSRSQFFSLGSVTRDLSTITAIAAKRDRPTVEHTDDFYRVFTQWMNSIGINLGSRGAK